MKVSRSGSTVILVFDNIQSAIKAESKYKGLASYNERAVPWCKRQKSESRMIKRGGIE